MKVQFKKGFSLNGVWFEKQKIIEFDLKTAKALIKRDVVEEFKDKKSLKTKE